MHDLTERRVEGRAVVRKATPRASVKRKLRVACFLVELESNYRHATLDAFDRRVGAFFGKRKKKSKTKIPPKQ